MCKAHRDVCLMRHIKMNLLLSLLLNMRICMPPFVSKTEFTLTFVQLLNKQSINKWKNISLRTGIIVNFR